MPGKLMKCIIHYSVKIQTRKATAWFYIAQFSVKVARDAPPWERKSAYLMLINKLTWNCLMFVLRVLLASTSSTLMIWMVDARARCLAPMSRSVKGGNSISHENKNDKISVYTLFHKEWNIRVWYSTENNNIINCLSHLCNAMNQERKPRLQ